MLRRIATLAATSALLLVLVGCGSDGEASTADTDGGEDASTTTGPAVDAAADEAAAEAAIAVLEEVLVDKGFAAEPDDDAEDDESGDDDDFEFVSDSCRRFQDAFPDDGLEGETANEEMDSYEREDAVSFETVAASVGMTAAPEDLDEVMALLGDSDMGGCLAEAMQMGIQDDQADTGAPEFEMQDLQVATGEVEGLGDENVRFEIGFTMAGAGLELPMSFEMLMVRDGRVAVMTMVGVGGVAGGEATVDAEGAARILLDELSA